MENKIRHLEMIESIIDRMANNSFVLKGWAITLIAAIFALADKTTEQKYILIAYVPLIVFWFLDSYYLQLERKYKALFIEVRLKNEKDIDFNMDFRKVDKKTKKNNKLYYYRCLFAITECFFYIPVVMVITIIMKIMKIF